jgi:hypothetical protein
MSQSTPTDTQGSNTAKQDLRLELEKAERQLADLQVSYEQYFLGVLQFSPDKPHQDFKRLMRQLQKAPFKGTTLAYRMRTLETRYQTYNTYWQRVLKQREDGTYVRDVFKANMRERNALEDARALTKVGQAEKGLQALFRTYKTTLEQVSGSAQNLDFDAFQKNVIQRAKDFKAQTGAQKVSFKIVTQDGKVSVQIRAKEPKPEAP